MFTLQAIKDRFIKFNSRHSDISIRQRSLVEIKGFILIKTYVNEISIKQMRLLKNQQVVALVSRYQQKISEMKVILDAKKVNCQLLTKQLDQYENKELKISPDVSTCQGFQTKRSRQRKVSRKLSQDRNFCIQCQSTLRQNQELKHDITQLQNIQQQYAEYKQIKDRHKEILKEALHMLSQQEVKNDRLTKQKQKRTEIQGAFAALICELVRNKMPAKTAEIALAAGRVCSLPKELQSILLKKVQQMY